MATIATTDAAAPTAVVERDTQVVRFGKESTFQPNYLSPEGEQELLEFCKQQRYQLYKMARTMAKNARIAPYTGEHRTRNALRFFTPCSQSVMPKKSTTWSGGSVKLDTADK
eukprot:COSAG03_NODE_266_length_9692_cov_13.725216_16_plen_111_part_01